jgi:hypothetical protein
LLRDERAPGRSSRHLGVDARIDEALDRRVHRDVLGEEVVEAHADVARDRRAVAHRLDAGVGGVVDRVAMADRADDGDVAVLVGLAEGVRAHVALRAQALQLDAEVPRSALRRQASGRIAVPST